MIDGGIDMEEKLQKGREKVLSKLDFPPDIAMDLPKIIVIGNRQITIENHKGILVFENDLIKINSRIGTVSVKGNNFEILFIGETSISVSGTFKEILYEG